MMLWLIFLLMTAGAVLAICWPLLREQKPARSGNDIAVYRDQLDEIGRDEAANLIGSAEADAARIEVSRRMLAAAESVQVLGADTPARARLRRLTTFTAVIVLLPFGAGAVYFALGSPNLAVMSTKAQADDQAFASGIEQTIARVEAHLEKNPRDGRGWELLAPVYMHMGRFDDAVRARRNALEIFGPDAARLGDLGEAIFVASGRVMTAEAKNLFIRAEAADPQDVMAQYYLGVSAKQDGHREEAERRWRALVSSAPESAEWLPMVRNALAHIDDNGPQPSAASADHGGDAIEAMVERLAERLKKDGSDVKGWVQLVRSYRVLGKGQTAEAAIADARAALVRNPAALKQLEADLQALEADTMPAGPSVGVERSTSAGANALPRPSPGDVVAAAKMTASERNEMIEGMVARLAQRMAANGSDIEGWLRLIRAYSVLGERDKALAAMANARSALAGDNESLGRIAELAKELGLNNR